jgi:ribosomal protein S18 acetylase RimI-like enzyme
MTTRTIEIAPTTERERGIGVITAAFIADPVMRWVFPDPSEYLRHVPSLVQGFAGRAFEQGSAFRAEGFAGAALWLPPGVGPDEEAMIALLEEAIPNERKEEMYGFLEQQGANHARIPQEHWYLPLIGVDPSQQGQGHGSALLEHTLARIDQARLPAYLEATNANNKRLYERHGFEEVGVIQYGASPPMWPMLRKAR